MKESLISPEVRNYGEHKKAEGYVLGFNQAVNDARRRRLSRQKTIRKLFGQFWDYIDDQIANNKRH